MKIINKIKNKRCNKIFNKLYILGNVSSFVFNDIIDAPLNTVTESNYIIFNWFGTQQSISVIGLEYSINDGIWTSDVGVINYLDTLKVRLTSSGINNTIVSGTVTIGADDATFNVTTVAV